MLHNPPNWEELYRTTIYAVSHDLRAPCRQMRSFSELLSEEQHHLTADSLKLLNYINTASTEAQAMLDGLLKLSRVFSEPAGLAVISAQTLAQHFKCTVTSTVSTTASTTSNNTANSQIAEAHICANLDELDEAAQALADNARAYAKFTGFEVFVRPKWLTVTALQEGPAIADANWSEALRPLQRIGQRRTTDHVGMGLTIAMAIANAMHGTLINQPQGIGIDIPLL